VGRPIQGLLLFGSRRAAHPKKTINHSYFKSTGMKIVIAVYLSVTSLFCAAQNKLIVIKSNGLTASLRVDKDYYKDAWNISPQVKPDVQEIPVHEKPVSVSFVTDIDSIHFLVEAGKQYNFIVLVNGKDSAYTQIKGELFINPASFSKQYIAVHNNKTFVEIPEVYELVNIIYAITPTGKKDEDMIYKESGYYKEVLAYFDTFNKEPAVMVMDSLLQGGRYANVKMDAYSFAYGAQNKIIKTAVYDRISSGTGNTLAPFIQLLQAFSEKTGFRTFFAKHAALYKQQITDYRDSLNTKGMQLWLNKNFPTTRYNSFKIIFTPLVAYDQSANWFENNGFKEAQAHVNYPYPADFSYDTLSEKAIRVMRGNIVFTELNHAFINPEAGKPQYETALRKAFADLDKWIEKGKPAQSYSDVYSCFQEYMNWVLVSLRYVDEAPKKELDKLLQKNELNMTKGRGFKKFTEFDKYVVDIYRNRKPGQTVADLYPQIIDWCNLQ
jgi:Domain of unknown function (DUF4932)